MYVRAPEVLCAGCLQGTHLVVGLDLVDVEAQHLQALQRAAARQGDVRLPRGEAVVQVHHHPV
jgi:hypothetical protein